MVLISPFTAPVGRNLKQILARSKLACIRTLMPKFFENNTSTAESIIYFATVNLVLRRTYTSRVHQLSTAHRDKIAERDPPSLD
jgi:hypothetical protein